MDSNQSGAVGATILIPFHLSRESLKPLKCTTISEKVFTDFHHLFSLCLPIKAAGNCMLNTWNMLIVITEDGPCVDFLFVKSHGTRLNSPSIGMLHIIFGLFFQ